MARIPQYIIDEVLDKTDIVDIVSEQVALSKKGKSYFGLCPFHHEKTPSFSVEPNMKIYNCFSCGEKGNAVTFLQKTKNINYIDAILELANKANINIEYESYQEKDPNAKYYQINEEACNFYQFYLNNTQSGKKALTYLKNRGIDESLIQQFRIGLAPSEYDLLYKTLNDKEYLVSDLYDLGLVKQSKNDTFYDLFRDRIIIPIIDEYNRVIAFSGRIYEDIKDDQPKYINSPQTKIFTKSNVLFNLNNAIQHMKQTKQVYLTEGYIDTIALYRANILDTVASMGTSLTTEQVQKIKRYVPNITILYDGDSAGITATKRAVKLAESNSLNPKVVLLNDGLDPDDYIQKYGIEALQKALKDNWMDVTLFEYTQNVKELDPTKMLDVEHFKKQVFDLIKNSPNTTIDHYLRKLSEDVKISLESVRQDFNQYTKRQMYQVRQAYTKKIPLLNKYENAELRLLNYFIDDYKYLANYDKTFDGFLHVMPLAAQLVAQIEHIYNMIKINGNNQEFMPVFLESLNEEQLEFYNKKVVNKNLQLFEKEYFELLDVMRDFLKQAQIIDLENKLEQAETKEQKIAIAEKIMEVKYGSRKNNSRVN